MNDSGWLHNPTRTCEMVHLEVTRHRESAINAIIRTYKITDEDQFKLFPNWQLFNLCKALVLLKENNFAEPIAKYLEENEYGDNIRRLRFQYWPDTAADYLIALYDDDKYDFKVNVGKDLTSSILGPIDCDLGKRTLGESGFLELLDNLSKHSKNEYEIDAFSWLSVLAKEKCEFSAILEVMQKSKTPRVQFWAAKKLLTSQFKKQALKTIQNFASTNFMNLTEAYQTLLEEGFKSDINVNSLRDVSIFGMLGNSAEAITLLFKLGDHQYAKIAAANYFAERNNQWSVVEALFEYDCEELGKAVAHWLCFYPGYKDRLKSCEMLLERGEKENATFALAVLATESHHTEAHQALEKLIRLNEIKRIEPLLFSMAKSVSAYERYEAAMLLAKANVPMPDDTNSIDDRIKLKLKIQPERQKAFIQARSNLYQTILNQLAIFETKDVEISEVKKIVYFNLAQSIKFYDHNIDVPQIALGDLFHSDSIRIKLFAWEPAVESGELNQAVSLAFDILSKNKNEVTLQYRWIALSMLSAISYIANENKREIQKNLQNIDIGFFKIPAPIIRLISLSLLLPIEIYAKDKDRDIRAATAYSLRFKNNINNSRNLLKLFKDKDDLVRAEAFLSLVISKRIADKKYILDMLSDESYRVRRSASYSLWLICDSNDIQILTELLYDEDHIVRANAIYIGRYIGDKSLVDDLIYILNDKHKDVRRAAAFVLGEIGENSCVEYLANAVKDLNTDVKISTAIALGKIGNSQAAIAFKNILLDRNLNVRRAALRALKEMNCTIDSQILFDALKSQDPHHQCAAIDILIQLNEQIPFEILKLKIKNHNSWVRQWTAWSFGFLGKPKTVPYLNEALKDTRSNVRRAAIQSLGRLYVKNAIPDLVQMLGDQDYTVRRWAAWSLGQIGDERAIEPLIALLNDNVADVRQHCANALGEFENKQLYKCLLPLLDDPSSNVRRAAAIAIGKIGNPDSVKYLELNNQSERLFALTFFPKPNTQSLFQLYSWLGNETAANDATFSLIRLNPQKALEEIDQINIRFPKREWLYRAKGFAYQKLQNNKQAESSFQTALHLAPESIINLLSLARFYFETDEFGKAFNLARKAYIIAPLSAISSLSNAVFLWGKNQRNEAIDHYNKAKLLDRHIDKEKSLRFKYFVGDKFVAVLNELQASQLI